MSQPVLIDSSIWIFTFERHQIAEIKRRTADYVERGTAATTSPIVYELLSGARTPQDAGKIRFFLSNLHFYSMIEEEWLEAADWVRSMRMKGLSVSMGDGLIAFKAIKHNVVLVHADAGFDRIAKKSALRVESFVDVVRHHFKK